MTAIDSSIEHNQLRNDGGKLNFTLRALILIVVVAALMRFGNVNIGAIGQGLGYALAGVTVFLTFRVLGFVDLPWMAPFPLVAPSALYSSSMDTAPNLP